MPNDLIPPAPPQVPQPQPSQKKAPSLKGFIGVFISAFIMLMLILNFPSVVKAIEYPFKHTAAKDNEQLTQEYRDIYGYEKHPELINAVEAATNHPAATSYPIVTGTAEIAELSIPKIGIEAPVYQVASSDDTTILNTLKKGVVLYPGSVMPGQPGTAVIVGHSSSTPPWTQYSDVFAMLNKLQPNDLIYITAGGTGHIYRVRSVKTGSAQELIDSGLTGDLVLSTCWPVGTDRNRVAVSADRIQ